MANVPYSQTLKDAIIAEATKPFAAAKARVRTEMSQNKELQIMIFTEYTNAKQVQLALNLNELNTDWFAKYHAAMQYSLPELNIQADMTGRINPIPRYETYYPFSEKCIGKHRASYAFAQTLAAEFYQAGADEVLLTTALNSIFENTTSLNKAIDAMPAIRDWRSDETKKRLTEVKLQTKRITKSADDVFSEAFSPEAKAAAMRAKILK